MMVKHGNWNALQKSDAELHKEEQEHRAQKISAICGVARRMYELLCDAELTKEERAAALNILNTFVHQLRGK